MKEEKRLINSTADTTQGILDEFTLEECVKMSWFDYDFVCKNGHLEEIWGPR